MALFGKKKGETPSGETPNNPANATDSAPQKNDGAFDFDAIARDLEAQNGPSAFDDLLAQPASAQDDPFAVAPSTPVPPLNAASTGSAFDFPEDFSSIPVQTTPSQPAGGTDLNDLDTVFGEGAPTTPTQPSAPATPNAAFAAPNLPPTVPTPATASAPSPEPAPRASRPFPLIPALFAAGILGAAGLAGWYFTRPPAEEPTPLALVAPSPVPTAVSGDVPEVVPTPLATVAPIGGAPVTNAPVTSATPLAATTTRNSSTTVTTTVTAAPRPTAAPTASTVAPEILAQLKALWEQGRDAKARGDYASARQFWQEALRIRPGHPGFQESIDKLPPATTTAPAAP